MTSYKLKIEGEWKFEYLRKILSKIGFIISHDIILIYLYNILQHYALFILCIIIYIILNYILLDFITMIIQKLRL